MRILEHRGVDFNERVDEDEGMGVDARRVPREEIEALERIVGALSGQRGRRNDDGHGEDMEE